MLVLALEEPREQAVSINEGDCLGGLVWLTTVRERVWSHAYIRIRDRLPESGSHRKYAIVCICVNRQPQSTGVVKGMATLCAMRHTAWQALGIAIGRETTVYYSMHARSQILQEVGVSVSMSLSFSEIARSATTTSLGYFVVFGG